MKKIFFILILSLSLIHASDLLFKASKGKLSSTTANKLSDEQMAEVKGGIAFYYMQANDGSLKTEFGSFDYRTGRLLTYSLSYVVVLSNTEERLQSLAYGPGTARTNYMIFKNFADSSRGEVPVISLYYNVLTQSLKFDFAVFNVYSNTHRIINDPLGNDIIQRHNYELASQFFGDARNFLSRRF